MKAKVKKFVVCGMAKKRLSVAIKVINDRSGNVLEAKIEYLKDKGIVKNDFELDMALDEAAIKKLQGGYLYG